MKKPDSIIFDMDGTLWDPMDLYVSSWNAGLKDAGVPKSVTKDDIKPLMGIEGKKVLAIMLPEYNEDERQEIYGFINRQRSSLIEKGQGNLFEGMQEGIRQLSSLYKLFIVSNCPAGLIQLFMKRAEITEFITDEMAYGVNSMPKHHNMKLLIDKYSLEQPVYVGDTDGDREQSEKAGIPFVYLACGFGEVEKYDLKFNDFRSFTSHFLNL